LRKLGKPLPSTLLITLLFIPALRGNYLPSHNALNGNGSGEPEKTG